MAARHRADLPRARVGGTVSVPRHYLRASHADEPNNTVVPVVQGDQVLCDPKTHPGSRCTPPSPCWHASEGTSIPPDQFGAAKTLRTAEGNLWVSKDGGGGRSVCWFPGQTVTIHVMLVADHNGVYRWESQLAAPGEEAEGAFKNFTPWRSVNNDPDTNYYDTDGVTPLVPGNCSTSPSKWSPHVAHCRDNTWGQTSLKVPLDMPAGRTVVRWLWYGAMTTGGQRLGGGEHSLFVSCADVTVGTPAQCGELARG
eukprot:CAMPEP_0179281670 /NCGR_PEP_ID=MMETSP0797-20121207/37276_1 /TAXON_ID=47934 /ORGANISM="Dinophysis acuminata, Strain DAEP01" /LENGTH=253 /DNA_ID=CAMNT_0020990391 /DNA_START=60 /DNA_END=818 /DNA_ORIENTATION=-